MLTFPIPRHVSRTRVKKTAQNGLSEAEQRRCEEIITIQNLFADGFAPVQIKEMLHTTYFRIRRYAAGDPHKLCRFDRNKFSQLDQYQSEIIALLKQNLPFKQSLEKMTSLGYQGKRTAFESYCRKLIAELEIPYTPRINTAGIPIETKKKPKQHYVCKSDILRHIWSGKEIECSDMEFILKKYPQVSEMQQCIHDFREIYNKKNLLLLDQFIERYSTGANKPIRSFASGLRGDLEAVKNSVISDLNSGFVEGINNKIKAIKRMMYGRAKIDLLRVKVLFAR